MNDTIYALSSASGVAGVSVIRISGSLALCTVQSLTGRKDCTPRYAYFDKYSFNNQEIDSGLTLYFQAPFSFTGEDVVELQVHGSHAVLNKLFEIFEGAGLRLANAGEFTRRAFENGKMDLLQVSGLMDLINAQTEAQRKQSLHFQTGEVSQIYNELRNTILQAQSLMEASIDFSEDELPNDLENKVENLINDAQNKINEILTNNIGDKIVNGFVISLIGQPNAGKSTLFNLLLGQNKAIVSAIAGTTRDVLEATLDIAGYKVILADTAGIHDSGNEIEKEGIKRARELAKNADLKIYVVSDNFDESLVDEKTVIVYNKSDVLKHKINENLFNPQFIISTVSNEGISEFKNYLKEIVIEKLSASSIYFTKSHHKVLLNKANDYLTLAQMEKQTDLKAENLKRASNSLAEVIGTVSLNDLLDKIFSSFCIGK